MIADRKIQSFGTRIASRGFWPALVVFWLETSLDSDKGRGGPGVVIR